MNQNNYFYRPMMKDEFPSITRARQLMHLALTCEVDDFCPMNWELTNGTPDFFLDHLEKDVDW